MATSQKWASSRVMVGANRTLLQFQFGICELRVTLARRSRHSSRSNGFISGRGRGVHGRQVAQSQSSGSSSIDAGRRTGVPMPRSAGASGSGWGAADLGLGLGFPREPGRAGLARRPREWVVPSPRWCRDRDFGIALLDLLGDQLVVRCLRLGRRSGTPCAGIVRRCRSGRTGPCAPYRPARSPRTSATCPRRAGTRADSLGLFSFECPRVRCRDE